MFCPEIETAETIASPVFAVDLGVEAILLFAVVLIGASISLCKEDGGAVRVRVKCADAAPLLGRGEPLRLASVARNTIQVKRLRLRPVGQEKESISVRRPPRRCVLMDARRELMGRTRPVDGDDPDAGGGV